MVASSSSSSAHLVFTLVACVLLFLSPATYGEFAEENVQWVGKLTASGHFSPRSCHATVPLGQSKLLVFGGRTGRFSWNNDLNLLDADTMTWTQVEALSGTPPEGRGLHSAVLIDKKLYIFGGRSNVMGLLMNAFSDLAVYDTNTMAWTKVQAKGYPPPARMGQTSTAVGLGKFFVFGGFSGIQYLNDLYAFDVANYQWTKEERTGGQAPEPRSSHTAVAHEDRLIIFGGKNQHRYLNDVSVFDTKMNSWKLNAASGLAEDVPSPRSSHSMVIVSSKILVFGGYDGKQFYNDLYLLHSDTLQWTKLHCNLPSGKENIFPTARDHATLTPVGNVLYLIGGWDGSNALDDIYKLDTGFSEVSWTRIYADNELPTARRGHTLTTFTHSKTQVLLFGGVVTGGFFSLTHYLNDVHIFDLLHQRWKSPVLLRNVPTERSEHTATTVGNYIVIFGGETAGLLGSQCTNELNMFNTELMGWVPMEGKVKGDAPSPRKGHTATLLSSNRAHRLFIFGGYDGNNYLSDIHILRLQRDHFLPNNKDGTANEDWSWINNSYNDDNCDVLDVRYCKSNTNKQMIARARHTTVSFGSDRLVVFGGVSSGNVIRNDVLSFNTESGKWEVLHSGEGNAPTGRVDHVSALVEDGGSAPLMVIFGGSASLGTHPRLLDDLWSFDLNTHRWRRHTVGDTFERSGHAAVLYNHKLFAFGGFTSDSSGEAHLLNDMRMLDIAPILQQQQQQHQQTVSPTSSWLGGSSSLPSHPQVDDKTPRHKQQLPTTLEPENKRVAEEQESHKKENSEVKTPPVSVDSLKAEVKELLHTFRKEEEERRLVSQEKEDGSIEKAASSAVSSSLSFYHLEIELDELEQESKAYEQRLTEGEAIETIDKTKMEERQQQLARWFSTYEEHRQKLAALRNLVAFLSDSIRQQKPQLQSLLTGDKATDLYQNLALTLKQHYDEFMLSEQEVKDVERELRSAETRFEAADGAGGGGNMQRRLQALKETVEELQAKSKSIETRMEELRRNKEEQEKESEDVRTALRRVLPFQTQQLQSKEEVLVKELDGSITPSLERERQELLRSQRKLLKLEQKLKETEEKKQVLKQLKTVTRESEEWSSDLQKLFTALVGLDQQAARLLQQLTGKEEHDPLLLLEEELRQEEEEAKLKASAENQLVGTKQEKEDRVPAAIEKKRSTEEELEKKLQERKAMVAKIEEQIQRDAILLSQALTDLRKQTRFMEERIIELERQEIECKEKLTEVRQQLLQKKGEIARAEERSEELRLQLQHSTLLLEEAIEEKSRVETRQRATETELSSLTRQHEESTRHLRELERTVVEKRERAEEKLKTLRDSFERCKHAFSALQAERMDADRRFHSLAEKVKKERALLEAEELLRREVRRLAEDILACSNDDEKAKEREREEENKRKEAEMQQQQKQHQETIAELRKQVAALQQENMQLTQRLTPTKQQ
ncbi:BTB domain-containing protein [Balamuthia mandrillaris]